MIAVSACLLGVKCKYDGTSNHNDGVLRFDRRHWAFIAICPELLGGLPIPRGPFEIVNGTGSDVISGKARVMSKDGGDTTEEFLRGAEEALAIVKRNGIEMAVLKARSPSCGVCCIYDGTFSRTIVPGDGVTAALLKQHGVRLIAETDLSSDRVSNIEEEE